MGSTVSLLPLRQRQDAHVADPVGHIDHDFATGAAQHDICLAIAYLDVANEQLIEIPRQCGFGEQYPLGLGIKTQA